MTYDELPVGEHYQFPGLPHRVLWKLTHCSVTEDLKMFIPKQTQEVSRIDRDAALEIMSKRWKGANPGVPGGGDDD
jgi:hypothetical protein